MTNKTIKLETPIKRGEQSIAEIQIRKPYTGDVRGINLSELAQLNVDAIIKLATRITTPTLTEQEAKQLDIADILELGVSMISFFEKKAAEGFPTT